MVLSNAISPTTTVNQNLIAESSGPHQLYLPILQGGNPNPVGSDTINGNVINLLKIAILSIIVRAPNGETTTEELTLTGSDWSYALNPSEAGSYRIWVRAVDEAGNITQTESYEVEVVGLTDRLWLPLISN